MSRMHRKSRSQRSSVGAIELRPRVSRHGKLLADVFMLPEVVQVNHGTRVNPNTGMVEAYTERKVIRARRPMTPAEIEATRNRVVRALHPTTHYAQKNGADVKKKDKES